MSERACIRGCVQRGVHYATCGDYGREDEATCSGCAPRECRDGSLICDRCFGRMRALLQDGPDLIGRLRSLADPMKATPTDQVRVASSSMEPPAPVSVDVLDALTDLDALDPWWHADLASYTNDLEVAAWLIEVVLVRHPEADGARALWSVQDAVDKWGVERRTDTFVYPADDVEEVELGPVREWYDPLLTLAQAATRAKVTQRQVRRWVEKEVLVVVAKHRGPRGSVLKYVHASAVDAVASTMREKQAATRFAVVEERGDTMSMDRPMGSQR